MIMNSKHLIPLKEKWENKISYIVFTEDKKNKNRIYVKTFGVQKFPTLYDDAIVEQTEHICDALLFCRKEDAEKVAGLCTFKCDCGCRDVVGKLLVVTPSERKMEGVTYGEIKSSDILENRQERFDVVFDVTEDEKEYPAQYDNLFDM